MLFNACCKICLQIQLIGWGGIRVCIICIPIPCGLYVSARKSIRLSMSPSVIRCYIILTVCIRYEKPRPFFFLCLLIYCSKAKPRIYKLGGKTTTSLAPSYIHSATKSAPRAHTTLHFLFLSNAHFHTEKQGARELYKPERERRKRNSTRP